MRTIPFSRLDAQHVDLTDRTYGPLCVGDRLRYYPRYRVREGRYCGLVQLEGDTGLQAEEWVDSEQEALDWHRDIDPERDFIVSEDDGDRSWVGSDDREYVR